MERRRFAPLDFDDLVYGIHAVAEALVADDPLRAIHVATDRKKDGPLRSLLAQAKERNIAVRFEKRAFFERIPFKAHQGVVAVDVPVIVEPRPADLADRPEPTDRDCLERFPTFLAAPTRTAKRGLECQASLTRKTCGKHGFSRITSRAASTRSAVAIQTTCGE